MRRHSRDLDHTSAIKLSLTPMPPGFAHAGQRWLWSRLARSLSSGPHSRYPLAWPGRREESKQRRDLAYPERPEKHRTVDEAQRKSPRLLAFQNSFAAE